MIPLILHFMLLQTTTYQMYLNSTISNSTDPAMLLQNLNSSPAFGGYLGFTISLAVFVIFTLAFSFRIKIVQAALAASLIALVSALIGVWLGITSTGVAMLFIAIGIIMGLLTATSRILYPFD